MELHDHYDNSKEWNLQKFRNIIKTNAHYDYSKSKAYLFPVASRMNHSWRILFKSITNIKKNEEITCSYLSITELLYNRKDRRNALKERFECNCARCKQEQDDDVITNTSIEIPSFITTTKSMMKDDVEDCLKFYTDLSEYEGVNTVTKGYIVLYGTDTGGIPPLCDLLQFRDRMMGLEEKIEDLIRSRFRRTVKDFYRDDSIKLPQGQKLNFDLKGNGNGNGNGNGGGIRRKRLSLKSGIRPINTINGDTPLLNLKSKSSPLSFLIKLNVKSVFYKNEPVDIPSYTDDSDDDGSHEEFLQLEIRKETIKLMHYYYNSQNSSGSGSGSSGTALISNDASLQLLNNTEVRLSIPVDIKNTSFTIKNYRASDVMALLSFDCNAASDGVGGVGSLDELKERIEELCEINVEVIESFHSLTSVKVDELKKKYTSTVVVDTPFESQHFSSATAKNNSRVVKPIRDVLLADQLIMDCDKNARRNSINSGRGSGSNANTFYARNSTSIQKDEELARRLSTEELRNGNGNGNGNGNKYNYYDGFGSNARRISDRLAIKGNSSSSVSRFKFETIGKISDKKTTTTTEEVDLVGDSVATTNDRRNSASRRDGAVIPAKEKEPYRLLFTYPLFLKKNTIGLSTDDRYRLQDGMFLSDAIIDFYLRYLMEEKYLPLQQEQEEKPKIHLCNSFFFKVLCQGSNNGKKFNPNSQSLQRWTRNLDPFQYDFIIVPVHESAHWYVSIICYPQRLCKYAEVTGSGKDVVVEEEEDEAPVVAVEKPKVVRKTENRNYLSADYKLQSKIEASIQNQNLKSIIDNRLMEEDTKIRSVNLKETKRNALKSSKSWLSSSPLTSALNSDSSIEIEKDKNEIILSGDEEIVHTKVAVVEEADKGLDSSVNGNNGNREEGDGGGDDDDFKDMFPGQIDISSKSRKRTISNSSNSNSIPIKTYARTAKSRKNPRPKKLQRTDTQSDFIDLSERPKSVEKEVAEEEDEVVLVDNPTSTSSATGKPSKQDLGDPWDDRPFVLVMDSLGSSRNHVSRALKDYLVHEIKQRYDSQVSHTVISGVNAKVPRQPNHYDCGVYVLQYIEEFLKDPKTMAKQLAMSTSGRKSTSSTSSTAPTVSVEKLFTHDVVREKRAMISSLFDHYEKQYQEEREKQKKNGNTENQNGGDGNASVDQEGEEEEEDDDDEIVIVE
ncbi:hypothetical protein MP638_003694 [Amoeboaphelidium occidentale]|nr:hypothetical protein MP638_003694 [Amoeboaphelidium occidentale]